MLRKCLATGLLLALCSLLFIGRASAQTNSFGSLRALLVTQSDISDSGLSFVSDDQQQLDGNVIQVIREFGTGGSGGSAVAVVSLIAATDGSTPPTSVTNQVASGELLKVAATSIGAQVGSFTLTGSQGVGDLDQSAQFDAVLDGTSYRFYGDSSVSGNLVVLVLYGAPSGQADSDILLSIITAQDDKLP